MLDGAIAAAFLFSGESDIGPCNAQVDEGEADRVRTMKLRDSRSGELLEEAHVSGEELAYVGDAVEHHGDA